MSKVQQLIEQPKHRNSLGYVIMQRGIGVGAEDAMIVWGIKPDGTRLFIDEARRGRADHLRCECGADLIARKGDVRAHHFAHASGAAQCCKEAHLHALSKFAADALKRLSKVRIPRIPGKPEITGLADAIPEVFGDFGGVRIVRGSGDVRRELCILLAIKRAKCPPGKERFEQAGISAMVVDLSQFRNSPDGRIADAIAFAADRSWLYNSRNPESKAISHTDPGGPPKSSRRTRGHSRGSPPTLHVPDVESLAAAAGDQAASSMDQTRPGSSDNQVDWSSLSPAELKKRLFGDRFGD
ncbi:hypothetical protein [Novosphingobium mangrovi (ex Huang et al. 2023)]|uniref:Uncharacterized protein n=1 Tax=Novosphingobium mangrovi (ex Huang et al. 2023) TaxID=2976432 RepID=A0ABT2IAI0_9SPHN|nr:hypothetical protein [Novosphingobium mangrovi (ex Huang et al. 2023)]MCT2401836.1 hypothetical protein [Novosphingobium mangrovi (ex Huang et al. 2023)]